MTRWYSACAALLLATSAGTSALADAVVRIGYLRAPNDVTLARVHGTLEKALAARGVRIEWAGPFVAAAPAMEAMNAGSIDITAGSTTSAITSLAADVPMMMFNYQLMSPSSQAILVPKDSPIRTIKDLVGHSVAVNRGGTGEYLLMRALEKNGIDPTDVKRVYLSPSDSGPSFTQGYVDAWATWDPFVTIAKDAYGARILADGEAIGSDNAVVAIVSRDFVEKKLELLKVINDVLEIENAWSLEHKQEAGAIWAREMNIPAAMAAEIGMNNAVVTHPVTTADVEQMGKIADWYFASSIVPRRPDIEASVVKLSK